ncbi:glycosyl hydrolase family 88 [Gemmatirosa kalamazoonensis]|uniref:Glycosyl hydrolase family 88 n=1 Tax=Gemmatirosa kalamazoonensis TaxID=861299 RepID=W0REV1_9BACT|nr:glycoside hydrolase family 88 protein [Gemmatirosa kalamazoonensis]AHG87908.1 glycosyl hydrolase family 88 [Gemmatirosa kalamazoonensis]
MTMLRFLAAITLTAATAGAQQQLGEGSPQPGNRPYAIPDSSGRPRVTATPWSVRFAESVMKRNPQTHRRWDYTAGVVLGAIEKVALARRDTAMLGYVRRNMERFVKPDGSIDGYRMDEFNIDAVSQGRLLFGLAQRTTDPRWRKAADLLREQLRRQPRTAEGGFWHKQIYPQQMWLDGLYMGEPFYAQYAKEYGEPAAFDDVARQFLLVARHTRDPRTSLMYHGWDAAHVQKWADSATGLSPSFWGRAMGWYMVGVVETLDYLPASHPDRAAIVQTLRDAAEGVARVQDPVTGLWWDVLDQSNRRGNYLEGSASSMFVYALAKAARLGYIDTRYRDVARRGLDGLLRNLVRENADGSVSLTNIVAVSGLGGQPRADGSFRSGTFEYYVGEPVVTDDYKGVGPFILAALELGK